MGRRHRHASVRASGALAVRSASRDASGRVRRRVPRVARRDPSRRARFARCSGRRPRRYRRGVHRRRSRAAGASRAAAAGSPRVAVHGRGAARSACPPCSRPRTSASRRSTSRRPRAAGARVLLVAAEDFRVHGGGTARRRPGGRPALPSLVGHEREGLLSRSGRARRACGRARAPRRRSRARRPARRGRAGARRPRVQLGGALPGARRTPCLEARAHGVRR